MGFTGRRDFTGGWRPDADALNAPENAYLRGDNLILDQHDVLALRRGSSKINSSAFSDTDVHSLFTTYINGTRYRMAGVTDKVYANGSSIATMTGSGDTPFGFQLGQILFARGTTKNKYDGSTVRNWGISMTGNKPTAVADDPDGKTFATFTSGESPAFTAIRGTISGFATLDGENVMAIQGAFGGTNDGIFEKVFSSPQDFTTYDGGVLGEDDDLISWFFSYNVADDIQALCIQIDVNDGTFVNDVFVSPVIDGRLSFGTTVDPAESSTGGGAMLSAARAAVKNAFSTGFSLGVKTVGFPATATIGGKLFRIQFKRSEFTRIGKLTNGQGWDTVKAIRVVIVTKPTILVTCVIGKLRITSAKLLGEAEWKYVYVRNASGYQARSGPSTASVKATFATHAATVTIPSDGSRDSQVNEIWLYRKDKFLDQFYRTAVKTGVSGTGSYTISDHLLPEDALILNLPLQENNVVPPDNIISIAGPHFDRTFVLTSDGVLWPSRKLDPDAFATTQAIDVCGEDETPLWVFKALAGGLFVGTTKDIYELSGTGAENPDGSMDFILRGLSMDHRPINPGLAHEGNQIVFFSDDGWRAMQGSGTTLLTGETSLLYKGQVRHAVGPVNMAGRVRAALGKGQLVAITPEGSATDTSCVLYRYVFQRGWWYRHPYGSANWLSLHREPDGTLIAGDDAGFVWILDTGTQDDGNAIAVTFWTKADHLDHPYQRKKIGDLMWRSESGGAVETIGVHINGSSSAATTLTTSQTGPGVTAFDLGSPGSLHEIAICRQIQFRMTGSFSAFHLYDFGAQYRERPIPLIGRVNDVLGGSPAVKILSGFVLKFNTLGAERVITPYLDGVADAETFTITTDDEEPETHELHFTLAGRRATDVGLSFDGEVEVDSWTPIVSQREPVGVKVWDSGPLDLQNNGELTWLRAMILKVRAEADLVITPYFDGTAFPTVTVPVTADADLQIRVPVGRAYVGRQPRLVVKSCERFVPYWARCYRRVTGPGTQKGAVQIPFTLQTGGEG